MFDEALPGGTTANDLPRHVRPWLAHLPLSVVAALISPSWSLRQQAVEYVAQRTYYLCSEGGFAIAAGDSGVDLASPAVAAALDPPSEATTPAPAPSAPPAFLVVCEVVELAVSDPVVKIMRAGLDIIKHLPVDRVGGHPRLLQLLEHVVLRCYDNTHRRIRCVKLSN